MLTILMLVVVLIAAYVLYISLPDILRYWRIRRM